MAYYANGGYAYPQAGYHGYYQPTPRHGHAQHYPQQHQYQAAAEQRSDSQGDISNSVYFKTKLCVKWKENACRYGSRCKYAHGEHELRQLPPSVVEMQKVQLSSQGGPSVVLPPNASEEQRSVLREALRKTKLCERQLRTQDCPWGDRCNFAHSVEEVRRIPSNLQDLINAAGSSGGAQNGGKRARGNQQHRQQQSVAPPDAEALPGSKSPSLADVQQRFEQLKRLANKFAADTGHSLALLAVGGVLDETLQETAAEGGEADGELFVRQAPPELGCDHALRCTVLKYGTGGVARQLVASRELLEQAGQQAGKAMAAAAVQSQQRAEAAAAGAGQQQWQREQQADAIGSAQGIAAHLPEL